MSNAPKVQFITNKTATTELPSIPGSEVTYRLNISLGEKTKIIREYPGIRTPGSADSIEGTYALITAAIVSWNFVDEQGKDIPVSREIVDLLPESDILHLQEKILPKIEKKKE